jgi:precorrin-2 methylase
MAGRLIIAGTGISAIAHLTAETIGYIKSADHVFYHATSGVMATKIHTLNPKATDLYALYGEEKVRTKTYVQMCELMLKEVRAGKTVVGLFHGHPGFFVKAGRRALAIADDEGYPTLLVPGISTPDCLLADLRIDPGFIGVQILKASHVLREGAILATNNHMILLQVSSVGDNTFSFSGYKHAKVEKLFEKLISVYGPDHESVYYVAPIFPGFSPVINMRSLGEYRSPEIQATIGSCSLYLPPLGMSVASIIPKQAFKKEPYGDMENSAIAELDGIVTPVGFKRREASSAMMSVMEDLGGNPLERVAYAEDPDAFLTNYSGLDDDETSALSRRDSGLLRRVTTEVVGLSRLSELTFEDLLKRMSSNVEVGEAASSSSRASISMRWSPEYQSMEFGGRRFEHHGMTQTDPSHDLAHLFVAANGELPWAPEGDHALIKLAEFSAVFIEHLLNNTFNTIHGQAHEAEITSGTVAYGRWFVEHHFAPFPISFEEAYRGLREKLKADTIARLSLYFFRQKLAERSNADYRSEDWLVSINSAESPKSESRLEQKFSEIIQTQILRMQAENAN